jgi:hypothetical protein
MAKPFPVDRKQVAAVQRVLYDRTRLRRLGVELSSIDALMNFDPARTLQPGDARVQAGAGPQWYLPGTGQLDPTVREAADRCDKVASLLLEMRAALGHVAFPAAHRRHLQAGIAAQAAFWKARGAAWRAPQPPVDAEAAATAVVAHVQTAAREFQPVRRYLRTLTAKDVR